MSYEKDKIDSFVTSVSLSTALAPFVTSASVSAAIAGLDLAPYMTSNSISAGVATDVLTVRGKTSVSATLSAAAVTVAGRPVGPVLLGHLNAVNRVGVTFSGSWSDFSVMSVEIFMVSGVGTTRSALATGASDILATGTGGSAISGMSRYIATISGHDGSPNKMIHTYIVDNTNGVRSQNMTATANAGFIDHFRFSVTGTASVLIASMYGWRKA
jgi:hypothetical protein